jgi:hypothetical protein
MDRDRPHPAIAAERKPLAEVIGDRRERSQKQPLDALKDEILPARSLSVQLCLKVRLPRIERRGHDRGDGNEQPDAATVVA